MVKESQFEEMLVRERVKDIDVTDRSGTQQKLTEARYQRFSRALHEFEGWASRLRADFGSGPANFVIEHRLVETDAALAAEIDGALSALEPNGYEVAVVESDADGAKIKVTERETSAAVHVVVPAELLASPVYANLRKTYARLVEIVGAPPVRARAGQEVAARRDVRDAARPRARARQGGHPGAALQGPRRDGSRGAGADDDGPDAGGC